MPFTQLAPELLLRIASWIDIESDLASLAQVNRDVYNTLITELDLRNANNPAKSAILITAASGNCSTLKKALQAWKVARGPAELPTSGVFPEKYPPLFSAAIRGHLEAVKMLLEHGADPNEGTNRPSAHHSTRRVHMGIQRFVRKTGGQTPLHSAIRNKQAELVRLLVNPKDVDPNALSSGSTPLQMAVQANEEDLVKILLTDKQINPDSIVNPRACTPLLEAAFKNNDAMVRLLLEAGANQKIHDSTFLSPAMLLDAPSAEARYKLIQEHSSMGLKDAIKSFEIDR